VITRPKLIAVLALPAGAIGYAVTASILSGLDLGEGMRNALLLFVPLFVAGLCMVPFFIPLFDAMAKRDLAEIQARRAAETPAGDTGDRAEPPTPED
jgi:hypothetical protein